MEERGGEGRGGEGREEIMKGKKRNNVKEGGGYIDGLA